MSTDSRAEVAGVLDHVLVPRVRIELRRPQKVFDDAVVDTGFAGSVTVPEGTLTNLGLGKHRIEIELADGSKVPQPFEIGHVEWFGEEVEVEMIETGTDAMVGMRLLISTRIEIGETTVTLSRSK